MLKTLLLVIVALSVSVPLQSQVVGSAQGPAHEWYAGAEYSRLNPDYWSYPTVYMNGLSVYGGYNDMVRHHYGFGVEGTWRTLLDRADGYHKEDSYLVSGRFIYRVNRFRPFVKIGGGLGDFDSKAIPPATPAPGQNGVHFIAAVGAGIDVRLTHRVSIRPLEWEQQVWTFSPHLLGPHSYSFGAAYRFR